MASISVLMCVYIKDNPNHFEEALRSIWDCQTRKPNEIVLVVDGPVTKSINDIVKQWKERLNEKLKVLVNAKNIGLTKSLNVGLMHVTGDFIARMDADDVSTGLRFKVQSEFLLANPTIDVVGSYIEEFQEGELNRNIRQYPLTNSNIIRTIAKASPLAHGSVMFRNSLIIDGVRYNEKYRTSQDLALWFFLLKNDYQLANIDRVLYKLRITEDFLQRRSSKKARKEFEIYFNGIISLYGFSILLIFPVLRLFIRISPRFIISFLYKSRLRNILSN